MSDDTYDGIRVSIAPPGKNGPAGWAVYLPHQCDEWVISGDLWPGYGATKSEAIADLERFIAEATEALEALRAGQPYPPQEDAG